MLRIFTSLIVLGFTLAIIGVAAVLAVIGYYGKELPDYAQLANYEPPNTSRLYAADGRLLEEYSIENRVFVPIDAIPKRVIQAFLAAEDRTFYVNPGIDFMSILRAGVTNFSSGGENLVGGSTITQQVVKNFLLTSEKTYERKIKEAILSFRISKAFSKDRILELYLNEIYLGQGSYGVAAAALNYFNKPLEELTVAEAAMLAAMPKAPSKFDPIKNHDRAKSRRDWVIEGMEGEGYITTGEASQALADPITLRERDDTEVVRAPYFAEEVRRHLMSKYGMDMVYKGGMVVRTTINPALQKMAERAFEDGLMAYDRRKGYRGPVAKIGGMSDWKDQLKNVNTSKLQAGWPLAVVLDVTDRKAVIGLADGSRGYMEYEDFKWAKESSHGLKTGDVITVGKYRKPFSIEDLKKQEPEKKEEKSAVDEVLDSTRYMLKQVPEISGGFVVMDPHTGKVLAMVGGLDYGKKEFNRVTQAKRQPGSAFKPYVYLTALENGFTPASIVVDGPISLSQGAGLPAWSPKNYSNDFLGPVTLRTGVEKSRNAMTVRLAVALGIDRIIEVGKRLGIYDEVPRNFSVVLGAVETTLLKLTGAYAILDNGGKKIEPHFVERIQDRYGKTIYRRDERDCKDCADREWALVDPAPPAIEDNRQQIVDPQVAYQMVSILNGVVERGTATRAKVLGRPLAGKTGTTNESFDTWFVGFSPDLVVGTYIGYDQPKTMGAKETGASVALPLFIQFMAEALKDTPPTPFRVPPGIKLSRVSMDSGQAPGEETPGNRIVLEAFRTGELTVSGKILAGDSGTANESGDSAVDTNNTSGVGVILDDGGAGSAAPVEVPTTGTGGLY